MSTIILHTDIAAPIERCFDLSLSVDLHTHGLKHTKEEAIAGVNSGLMQLHDEVTWRATHFGIPQTLTSKITAYERPNYFQDSMVTGIFKRFDHEHHFVETEAGTRVTDVFDWDSPLWVLGKIADLIAVEKHLKALLLRRNAAIKKCAETEDWRNYL